MDADTIRELRRERGLTQATLGEKFGVSMETVRDWEQGRRRPRRPHEILLILLRDEPDALNRALGAEGR